MPDTSNKQSDLSDHQFTDDIDRGETDEELSELGEEEVFTILSHPLRRTILKEIYARRHISFTELKAETSSSTGSIYHHIDKLGNLILQNDKKSYILSSLGIELVEQYLSPATTQVKVAQIESFTNPVQPIFSLVIERHQYLSLLVLVIVISGNILVHQLDAFMLGAVIIPQGSSDNISSLVSLGYTVVLFLILVVMNYLYTGGDPSILRLFQVFILSLSVSNVLILGVYGLDQIFLLSISVIVFALMNLISQVFFLTIITAGLIQYQGLNITRSISIAFMLLYIGLFLNIFV